MAAPESRRVINAALIGNTLVAVTKFVAAAITGSSAMLSEAVHTTADTGNELLLLYGMRRAARPPDADHPFGHGRELYFWSFVVALLVFLFAFAGTFAAHMLDRPVFDGAASLAIGVLLALIALGLARQTKSLLIGEPAHSKLAASIRAIAGRHAGVDRANGLFTVHIGPRQVVAALSVEFDDTLTAAQVESIVAEIEEQVRGVHPEVVSLLVKPQKSERSDFQLAPAEDER